MCTGVIFQNSLYHFVVAKKYCIQGKYLPFFIFASWRNLNWANSKQFLIIVSIKKNIYHTTVSGQIQDRVKPFTSVEGQKKTWAQITLYTVVIHILIIK